MNVPLLDLKAQYQTIREEIRKVVDEICDSQYFILGPHVEAMEAKIAAYCQTPHAVGVSSGSDALIIALMAAGIGAGDAVITTPYTFFATAGAVARVGARPLFVDIDPVSYNLDPGALENTVAAMDNGTRAAVKAILPVHLYGQCADMDPILDMARRHNWVVIEDAAQAIGAEYKGRRAGSMGDFGCFSFFPSKNLGAFGDGGVVTTTSAEMDQRLRMLRMHGMEPKYYHRMIGGNFRLDALQAAVVALKLDYLDGWTSGRQANAAAYRRLFQEAGLVQQVQLPVEVQNRHIYNQFVIRVTHDRDALRAWLGEQGIGTEVYYPVPLHQQECFNYLGHGDGDFPLSEQAATQSLALPIYPELSEAQLAAVVERIGAFYKA
ncbi:DegT/DnrJ/EryC1/StrS family aminotransferase [Desulfatitalea alkaliphila]|uniref:DegT/DnrJ/EryC1/StrS family aminotransferase n=1 Tax=Desulfatitalea alkaliphila TaxID=2929485 RepID=A0AA41R2B1_9BACT|nr:DegT/DnrJ/EryC1/StrS family aminotransferase [Desulfatitalea alkaliphila]MCJ8500797.1 DegT/DnrJ/EryC1/StrS family aminotransferase [Desulfatitalea alkaliphila]